MSGWAGCRLSFDGFLVALMMVAKHTEASPSAVFEMVLSAEGQQLAANGSRCAALAQKSVQACVKG